MTFHEIDGGRGVMPQLCVEIDFANAPTSSTRTWTDVTTDVRELSYTHGGRSNELQRGEAGTLTALLDNRGGDYDPTNTAGAYYPGVKRMRWMRVRAQWDSTIYARWQGLIETWSQQWPSAGKDATVAIRGTDAFKILNLFDLAGLSYAAATSDARVSDVCDDVGISATVDTEASSSVVATETFTEGTSALSHLLQVEESENGLLFAEADGTISFQGRHYRLLNSATASGTIGDAAGEIRYRDAQRDLDDADIWNIVAVTPSGGTAEVASDATSIEDHYDRRLNKSLLISSQLEAKDAAHYLAARYGDPSPRIPQIELLGAKDPTTWPLILAAKNSDRFTWKRRATAATISQDVFVERVSDVVIPGREWQVLLDLSPAADESGWVLADTTYGDLGSTTRVVY